MNPFVSAAKPLLKKALALFTPRRSSLYVPPCPPPWKFEGGPFMAWSTCNVSDLMHPEYARLCAAMDQAPRYHRKLWEHVFVIHHLFEAGVLQPGRRGIGFGVGTERLPSLFARFGAAVTATDAPDPQRMKVGWKATGEHSSTVDQLHYPGIVDREAFGRLVSHQACDMNAIDPALRDFDFAWSCCAFEHLGSLEAGMRFVIESVEKTLKVGGVACHTTEFNLSSDDKTVSQGKTVLYRHRDLLELVRRLQERGHEVAPFSIAPDRHYLDGHVDVPPYTHNPHLKLLLRGYVSTSAGIIVRRGR